MRLLTPFETTKEYGNTQGDLHTHFIQTYWALDTLPLYYY